MSFSIITNQLSPTSQNYLREEVYTSWHEGLLPQTLTLDSLGKGLKKDSEEILTILENLDKNEYAYQTECQQQLTQAKKNCKTLKTWTLGVALATLLLLTASSLLILFFPPTATIILPFFAAMGHWSPLLILTAFLPSLSLSISSLIKIGHCKRLQKKLEKNQSVLIELHEAKNHLQINKEAPKPSTSFYHEETNKIHARRTGIFMPVPETNKLIDSEEIENQAPVMFNRRASS